MYTTTRLIIEHFKTLVYYFHVLLIIKKMISMMKYVCPIAYAQHSWVKIISKFVMRIAHKILRATSFITTNLILE